MIYKQTELKNNANITELISFLILLTGNIFLYIIIRNSYHIAEPYAAAAGGIALALLIGKNNGLEKLNKTPKILEKFYNIYLPIFYDKISGSLNYIDNKILSNYKLILFISKLPVKITNWIEVNVMNKSVSFVSDISKELSRRDMLLQQGNVQTYNAYAFIIVTAIIALVIAGYLLIFGG